MTFCAFLYILQLNISASRLQFSWSEGGQSIKRLINQSLIHINHNQTSSDVY